MPDQRHEQRRHDLRIKAPVQYPVYWEFKGEKDIGYICDLSIHGCFIATLKKPPPGGIVSIYLTLPNWKKTIQISGEIREEKRKESGFGIKFEVLSELQEYAVMKFMLQTNKVADERRSIEK